MSYPEWRTYRDPERAPVPVAEVQAADYSLSVDQDLFEERQLPVTPHEGARGARSGREQGSGDHLSSDWLAEEPVLLTVDEFDHKILARPRVDSRAAIPYQYDRAPISSFDRPQLINDRVVFTPGRRWIGDYKRYTLEATPTLTDGVFLVEPGHIGPAGVRFINAPNDFVYGLSYAAGAGAFYVWDEDENPLPANTSLQLLVQEHYAHRRPLEGAEDAIVGPEESEVWARATRNTQTVKDRRRLPEFDPVDKWDSFDQAHFDGKPVPHEGNLWLIDTPSADGLQDAIDRTLPIGAFYRITSRTIEVGEGETKELQLQGRFDEDLSDVSLEAYVVVDDTRRISVGTATGADDGEHSTINCTFDVSKGTHHIVVEDDSGANLFPTDGRLYVHVR